MVGLWFLPALQQLVQVSSRVQSSRKYDCGGLGRSASVVAKKASNESQDGRKKSIRGGEDHRNSKMKRLQPFHLLSLFGFWCNRRFEMPGCQEGVENFPTDHMLFLFLFCSILFCAVVSCEPQAIQTWFVWTVVVD